MTEEEKEPISSNDSENKEPVQESLPLSAPVAEAIIEEAIVEEVPAETIAPIAESAPIDPVETPIVEEIVEPAIVETVIEEVPEAVVEESIAADTVEAPIEEIIVETPIIEAIVEPVAMEVVAEESAVADSAETPIIEDAIKPIGASAEPQHIEENSSFKNAIGIIGILLAVLALIYFATKKPVDTVVPLSNQNVSVSTTQEQGKVNIIEEVKNDLNILGGGSEDIVYQKIKATAYLGNTQKNPSSADCALAYPLEREIDKKYDSAMINSVLALLEPLTPAEKELGFVSTIPAGTILKYLKLDDSGVMSVNLSGNISKAAGSCAVTAIRSAITNTLSQFSSVKSVIICVDGNCNEQEILQP